jgi:uncharacterized protein
MLLSTLLVSSIFANVNYYQVSVKVDSASQNPTYFQKALNTALSRLTLDSDIANNPHIINALKEPGSYIKRYNFKKLASQWQLSILFNPKLIDKLIKQAQLRKWEGQRPTVLIWAVNHDQGNNQFSNDFPKMQNALKDQSTLLGIPINLPTMDIVDVSNINENDILTNNHKAITKASKRYDTDAILTLLVQAEPDGQLRSSWLLETSNTQFQWNLVGEDYEQIIKQGLAVMRQKFAEYRADKKQVYYLNIENINSTKAYEQLISYLNRTAGVKQVQIDSVTPNSVLYKLTVNTKIAALEKTLKRGHKITQSDEYDASTKTIYYRLST